MDSSTNYHYEKNAAGIANRYESADMTIIHEILLRHLSKSGKVLEIGGGSGRDTAFLLDKGFDVAVADASAEMIAAAVARHPELSSRAVCASFPLPGDSELLKRRFDSIFTIATLMHIPDQDLFECASQIRDLLVPGGTLLISSSIGREDLVDDRDRDGRLMKERPPEELQLLFERLGFRFVMKYETEDSLRRDIQWYSLVMQRSEGGLSRSVDEIETIISRDRKDATYKLALLRALCDIAQREHYMATWRVDGTVSVPMGLIAEKWLFYYWPLIERDPPEGPVAIPQKRGREINVQIKFRKSMLELIRFYRPHGGLSAMCRDFKSESVPREGLGLMDKALREIAETIRRGPVTYAGGALAQEKQYFHYEKQVSARTKYVSSRRAIESLGNVLVPLETWREMCLIGHWISESLVLRWAELTREFSKGSVSTEEVVGLLLTRPEIGRDVSFARSTYANTTDLCCVWTGKPLRSKFEVDHAIPFSIWRSNDLWNLLPAAHDVNSRKSDKLVTKRALQSSRDRVTYCWELMKEEAEERFKVEISRSLIRGPYSAANWQRNAFEGLVENVEILAIQRGVPRWEPRSCA